MAEIVEDNVEYQIVREERPSGAVTEQVVPKPGGRMHAAQARMEAIVAIRDELRADSRAGTAQVTSLSLANQRIKRLERVLSMVLAHLLDAADDDGT